MATDIPHSQSTPIEPPGNDTNADFDMAINGNQDWPEAFKAQSFGQSGINMDNVNSNEDGSTYGNANPSSWDMSWAHEGHEQLAQNRSDPLDFVDLQAEKVCSNSLFLEIPGSERGIIYSSCRRQTQSGCRTNISTMRCNESKAHQCINQTETGIFDAKYVFLTPPCPSLLDKEY